MKFIVDADSSSIELETEMGNTMLFPLCMIEAMVRVPKRDERFPVTISLVSGATIQLEPTHWENLKGAYKAYLAGRLDIWQPVETKEGEQPNGDQ